MILALALACAPEPTPLPAEKPAVVLVVLDTTRADLGGAEVPEWWSLGRRYTRATSADTHTVASAPVLLTGRPQTEGEKAASLGGGDCQGQKRPMRNLPDWPADIIEGGTDDRPVPATCVGQTARAVLGEDTACDLRTGRLPPEPPVVGMMVGNTWDERVIR